MIGDRHRARRPRPRPPGFGSAGFRAVPQHDDIAYEGRVDFVFKVDGVAYVVMTADRKCFRAEAVEVV